MLLTFIVSLVVSHHANDNPDTTIPRNNFFSVLDLFNKCDRRIYRSTDKYVFCIYQKHAHAHICLKYLEKNLMEELLKQNSD